MPVWHPAEVHSATRIGSTSCTKETVVEPHWHAPVTHVEPGPHAALHVPQWLAFEVTSTQLVPQSICPEGQPQAPSTHESPAAQAFPQLPQLPALLSRSTQLAPHCVSVPQPAEHSPVRQTSAPAHSVAQFPQCAASELTS
jgi:hypothetical protein